MESRNRLLELILSATAGQTGAGAVLSVTGDLVDNTDPIHPVVNPGVISLAGDNVDNADPKNPIIEHSSSFFATSVDTIPISQDSLSPSFFTGLSLAHADKIAIVDLPTGAMINNSGKTITMTGTVSINPTLSGGVTAALNIISERSNDGGLNWFGNLDSRRPVEVANSSESFGTKISLIIDWLPGQWLRFRLWTTVGNLSLVSTSATALGQTFATPSVVWELLEI
jgi:hypothetical protein